MKTLSAFILLFLGLSAPAANPSFQSFDTNTFKTNSYTIRLQAAVSNQWRVDITNTVNALAGLTFNPTNLALYGTTTNMDGDFAVRSNKMFRFDLANGTWTGNSIWWDQDHPARGEMHLDGEQFSFNDGLSLQKTAFSHLGSSVDSQGIWVFNHEGSATGTRTNSPSKQLGFSSQFWNGSASVVLLYGPRFWPGDTTGTNWALEWRVFGTSKVNRAGGTSNDTLGTNYHIMNQFGYGARQNAYSRPSFFNMNAPSNGVYFQTLQGDEVGLATENVRRLYVIDDTVTVADASFQSGSGGGTAREFTVDYVNHFVDVGKQSSTNADNTTFRVRNHAGAELFKVTATTGVANAPLTQFQTNTAGYTRLTNDFVVDTFYTNRNQRSSIVFSYSLRSDTGTFAALFLYLDEDADGAWDQQFPLSMLPNLDTINFTNTFSFPDLPPLCRFAVSNLSAPPATAGIEAGKSRWTFK